MSEIKMLPLPEDLVGDLYDYEDRELRYRPTRAAIHSAIQDYARAVAEHNVAARDAEIEALRGQLMAALGDAMQAQAELKDWRGAAEVSAGRAERLAEALRGLVAYVRETAHHNAPAAAAARAALRDHDQEGKDG